MFNGRLPLEDTLAAAIRSAMARREAVALVLRGDATSGLAARVVEGVPVGFRPAKDGRERIVLKIAEGTEQLVLLERVVRVLPPRTLE